MKDHVDKKLEGRFPSPSLSPSISGSDNDNCNDNVNANGNSKTTSPTSPLRNEYLAGFTKANGSDDSVDGAGAIPATQPELLLPTLSSRSHTSDSELSTLTTFSLDSNGSIINNSSSNNENNNNPVENNIAKESSITMPQYCPTKYSDEDVARIAANSFLPTPEMSTTPERETDFMRGIPRTKEPQRDANTPKPGPGEVYLLTYGRFFDRFFMKGMLPDAKYVGLAEVSGYRWLLCGPRREGEFYFFFSSVSYPI